MTLDIGPHYHQEFVLAPNSNSLGICCCWKSKTPIEFLVNEKLELEGVQSANQRQRVLANERLAILVRKKFDDVVETNEAFETLKSRVNENFNCGDRITAERLAIIVNTIYEVKKEISARSTPEPDITVFKSINHKKRKVKRHKDDATLKSHQIVVLENAHELLRSYVSLASSSKD